MPKLSDLVSDENNINKNGDTETVPEPSARRRGGGPDEENATESPQEDRGLSPQEQQGQDDKSQKRSGQDMEPSAAESSPGLHTPSAQEATAKVTRLGPGAAIAELRYLRQRLIETLNLQPGAEPEDILQEIVRRQESFERMCDLLEEAQSA
jgi:hypothetical protein